MLQPSTPRTSGHAALPVRLQIEILFVASWKRSWRRDYQTAASLLRARTGTGQCSPHTIASTDPPCHEPRASPRNLELFLSPWNGRFTSDRIIEKTAVNEGGGAFELATGFQRRCYRIPHDACAGQPSNAGLGILRLMDEGEFHDFPPTPLATPKTSCIIGPTTKSEPQYSNTLMSYLSTTDKSECAEIASRRLWEK